MPARASELLASPFLPHIRLPPRQTPPDQLPDRHSPTSSHRYNRYAFSRLMLTLRAHCIGWPDSRSRQIASRAEKSERAVLLLRGGDHRRSGNLAPRRASARHPLPVRQILIAGVALLSVAQRPNEDVEETSDEECHNRYPGSF